MSPKKKSHRRYQCTLGIRTERNILHMTIKKVLVSFEQFD